MRQTQKRAEDAEAVGNDEMLQVNEKDANENGREQAGKNGVVPEAEIQPGEPGDNGKENAGQQLHTGIPPGDGGMAVAALCPQGEKGHDRKQIKGPQAMLAPGAVRPGRRGNAAAARQPPDDHIEKGTDGEAIQRGHDNPEDHRTSTRPRLFPCRHHPTGTGSGRSSA